MNGAILRPPLHCSHPFESAARKAFTGANAFRLGLLLHRLALAQMAVGGTKALTEAQTRLLEAQQISSTSSGPDHPETHAMIGALVQLYEAWHTLDPDAGHAASADSWRARLPASTPDPAAK